LNPLTSIVIEESRTTANAACLKAFIAFVLML
jgi:hypothetical protein